VPLVMQSSPPIGLQGVTAVASTIIFIAASSNPMPSTNGTESLNQKIRDKIAQVAQSKVGSQNWLDQPNANKCNIFVHDVIKEAGQVPPESPQWGLRWRMKYILGQVDSKNYPAQSRDWANPNLTLGCWQTLTIPTPPPGFIGPVPSFPPDISGPGDIIAEAINYNDAFGHVGIVVGSRQTTSADSTAPCSGSGPAGTITISDYGFRPDNYVSPDACPRQFGREKDAVVKRFVCQ
jgi:cell wall-associated NlpC family hydrolase